jgi:acetyl esterase/lipase
MVARTAVSLCTLLVLLAGSGASAQPAQAPSAPPQAAQPRLAEQKPAAPIPDGAEVLKDIVYGKGGGRDLTLNLARPKAVTGPVPCVVVIHGGGWANGRKEQHDDLIVTLANRGYVAATVGYRLAPAGVFPAQVEDVKCAVRYLRAHADKYAIDPSRIGAVGFSAGAHLSMMLGVTDKSDGLEGEGGWPDESSKVQAVVSFFGPTDLAAPELFPDISPILRKFLGGTLAERPEAYKRASPINYVRADSAPMLLIQGTNDPLVNWKQAIRMAEALAKHDVDGRVEILLGLGHGWRGPELTRTAEATFGFFNEKLGKK